MMMILPVHILAGTLALTCGYVALFAAKGAPLHRRIGMFFVYAMIVMATTGLLIAAAGAVAPELNILTDLLTSYLVITGLMSVSPRASWSRRFEVGAMVTAFSLAATCFLLAASPIAGRRAGLAYPLVMFGVVTLAAGVGDRRLIRDGAPKGAARLQRHLWRMCFALFISSLALVAGRLPKALQIPTLNAVGVLMPLAAIAYWKWRLRGKRRSPQVEHMVAAGAV